MLAPLLAPMLALLPALVLVAGAASAQQVAFAKFSPLPTHAAADLTAPIPRDMTFGQPLELLEQTPQAARLRLDGAEFWVNRADIMVPDRERYMIAGPGYAARDRPVLRFWRSLGVASEFLSASDVRSAAPDLEEMRVGGRDPRQLRLPVLTRDVVDVMGRRSVGMAAVLLAVDRAVAVRFDALRGTRQQTIDIQLVVDASPDATGFSADTADFIYRQITRDRRRSGDRFNITLTLFGANFWDGVEPVGRVDAARIRDLVSGPAGAISDHDEPLLSALQAVAGSLDDTADQRLVIALSGADIVDRSYSEALRRMISLDDPQLTFPDRTALLLAQVTPEPGPGLAALARAPIGADKVVLAGFSETLGNAVMRILRDLLGEGRERVLSGAELSEICAAGQIAAIPCVLPYAPTTASVLPRPTRRGAAGDWYASIVWVVEDGLILKAAGPGD